MKPVIYIDVLFFVNFFINCILLFLTARIMKLAPGALRLCIGSIFGAVYSVLVFFPDMHFIYSAVSKFLFSMAIVAISYNIKGIALYLKKLGTFYLVTLSLGGGVLALFYFTRIGASFGAVIKNGILYMNLPLSFLIFAASSVGVGIRLVCRSMGVRLSRGDMYLPLSICIGTKKVTLSAFVDTGNTLREPISDYPVIIAEYEPLRPILPPEFSRMLECGDGEFDMAGEMSGKIRLIPFSSLGREKGMLIGFKPDKAYLTQNEAERDIGNIIVGVYKGNLAGDKSYSALLNPEII